MASRTDPLPGALVRSRQQDQWWAAQPAQDAVLNGAGSTYRLDEDCNKMVYEAQFSIDNGTLVATAVLPSGATATFVDFHLSDFPECAVQVRQCSCWVSHLHAHN